MKTVKVGSTVVMIPTRCLDDDIITPLAEIIKHIAQTHNPQKLRTDEGAERAAQYARVALAARGFTLAPLVFKRA
jgi:hypothetical protein